MWHQKVNGFEGRTRYQDRDAKVLKSYSTYYAAHVILEMPYTYHANPQQIHSIQATSVRDPSLGASYSNPRIAMATNPAIPNSEVFLIPYTLKNTCNTRPYSDHTVPKALQ